MNSILLPFSAVFVAVIMVFSAFRIFKMIASLDDEGLATLIFILHVIRAFSIGYLIYFAGRFLFGGEF